MKSRCIGCSNCVLACPFGVPRYVASIDQMMKCDMCFDRTSVGKKPMCATVCPSQALFFGPPEEIERLRRERPINQFQFGHQLVTTKVKAMTLSENNVMDFDVLEFMSGTGDQMNDLIQLSVWRDSYV
jgi:Fe-S-cluster-containing dehydrogenase component